MKSRYFLGFFGEQKRKKILSKEIEKIRERQLRVGRSGGRKKKKRETVRLPLEALAEKKKMSPSNAPAKPRGKRRCLAPPSKGHSELDSKHNRCRLSFCRGRCIDPWTYRRHRVDIQRDRNKLARRRWKRKHPSTNQTSGIVVDTSPLMSRKNVLEKIIRSRPISRRAHRDPSLAPKRSK